MAEKRMFSSLILNNDDFIDMPTEAQMLYIRLNMAADDRGICDSPRTVMRSCSASNDSMKLLIAKKFVLLPACKPSVVVIKHWWVHNSIRKERFKETKHTDVMSELFYDDNKSYSQNPNDGHISCILNGKLIWPPDLPEIFAELPPSLPQTATQLSTNCTPTVHQSGDSCVPQNREEENRLNQFSVDKDREGGLRGEQPTPAHPVEKPVENRKIVEKPVEKSRAEIEQEFEAKRQAAIASLMNRGKEGS